MKEITALRPVDPEDIPPVTELDAPGYVQTRAHIAGLSTPQLLVMQELAIDLISESPRTNCQLAEHLGMHRNTIGKYRTDTRFNRVLSEMVFAVTKGKLDVIMADLMKAAHQGKVAAIKLLLEYVGEYTQKIATLNMHVQAGNIDSDMDLDSAVDKFLIMLGSRGWNIQQLTARWVSLKGRQAF